MVAGRLELVDVNDDRVARLGAIDVERTGLRIVVSGRHELGRKLIGLRDRAVVAVFRPRHDAGARLDVHPCRRAAKCIR